MRFKLFGTKRRRVASTVTALMLSAGVAVAAWSIVTSSGSGTGRVGSLVAPTITNAGSGTGDLYPSASGFTAPIHFSINNPNTAALVLTSIASFNKTNLVGGNATCDWSLASIKGFLRVPASPVTGLSVAVPTGVSVVSVPNMLGLDSATVDQCQATTIDGIGVSNVTFSTP